MTRCGPWWMSFLLLTPLVASAAPQDPDVRIDPRADEQMHKMSDYLSHLKAFRFHASSSEDRVSTEGQKVQLLADQDVAVKRPNKLRTDRVDPRMDATLRYDGKQLSVFGKRTGYYA